MDDWFDKAMAELEAQLDSGKITWKEFQREERDLQQAWREEDEREQSNRWGY